MNKLFYTASKVLKVVPLQSLIALTNQHAIFPFYHCVSDEEVIHIKHLYQVRNIKSFESDLDFMLKNYEPVDISVLISIIKTNGTINKNAFLLTFDDGLREFYDVIAPILLRKGIPAICFLNSAFIDNKDLFFRYKASVIIDKLKSSKSEKLRTKVSGWLLERGFNLNNLYESILSFNYQHRNRLDELAQILELDFNAYLESNKPYLTRNQINSLIKSGFYFGAHSIDHPKYSGLDLKEQIFQTEESLNSVISEFNLDYRLFSFPFTEYGVSKVFFETIFNSKHPITDVTFGSAGLKIDLCKRNIQRIPIELSKYSAQEIIYGEYLYFIFKSFLNKNIINRSE